MNLAPDRETTRSVSPPDFVIDQVEKSYGDIIVFDDFDGVIEGGKTTGLAGPNGAGKTTLLDLLNGFQDPDGGAIYYGSRDLGNESPAGISQLGIRRTFQTPRLFDNLTVYENVQVALCECGGDIFRNLAGLCQITDSMDEEIRQVLRRYELDEETETVARNLSSGQRQLLSFARVTAGTYDTLLLDEPVSGVNPTVRQTVESHLRRLTASGKTIVVVEHDLEFLRSFAEEVLFIDRNGFVSADS